MRHLIESSSPLNIRVIFPKFSKPRGLRKKLKDNKHISFHLARKMLPGLYLFLKAYSFLRATLSENCLLLGTDNVRGQISDHISAPNEGYRLCILDFSLVSTRLYNKASLLKVLFFQMRFSCSSILKGSGKVFRGI